MSRRSDRIRLLHIRDHATEALTLVQGRSREDLQEDRVRALAVVRLLEIVGEAAAGVSPQTRAFRPDVPWGEMVGLRNRLIHGYDAVDLDIVWQIVSKDLPVLIQRTEQLLEDPRIA